MLNPSIVLIVLVIVLSCVALSSGFVLQKSIFIPKSRAGHHHHDCRSPVQYPPRRERTWRIEASDTRDGQSEESDGVTVAVDYLNSAQDLLRKFAMKNPTLKADMDKANFWTGGNFVIDKSICTGVTEQGLNVQVQCTVGGIYILYIYTVYIYCI